MTLDSSAPLLAAYHPALEVSIKPPSAALPCSSATGNPVAISSVVAIASKEHPVPFEMVGTLMESPVEILEEDALLLPRRLMKLIREVEGKAGHGKWGLLKQRCNGIEVAGDKAAQEEAV